MEKLTKTIWLDSEEHEVQSNLSSFHEKAIVEVKCLNDQRSRFLALRDGNVPQLVMRFTCKNRFEFLKVSMAATQGSSRQHSGGYFRMLQEQQGVSQSLLLPTLENCSLLSVCLAYHGYLNYICATAHNLERSPQKERRLLA